MCQWCFVLALVQAMVATPDGGREQAGDPATVPDRSCPVDKEAITKLHSALQVAMTFDSHFSSFHPC